MTESVIGFCRYCRDAGLKVGLSDSCEAAEIVKSGVALSPSTFKYALKALMCTQEEENELFYTCFDNYWGKRKHTYHHKTHQKVQSNAFKSAGTSVVWLGFQKGGQDDQHLEDARNVSGASRAEIIKKTDFTQLSVIDTALLEDLSQALIRELKHRLKRKMTRSKKGSVDIRKTIRENLSYGDMMVNLVKKNRKQDQYRLILLLDVSGSMDKYSFFLLKFIWSLKGLLNQVDAFVFSTRLVRITDMLHKDQLDQTLFSLSAGTDQWSGGTRIGACLQDFNERYAKYCLNGKSITIVLSDGLDHGEPEELAEALSHIKMRTKKLVWLNPLKGMQGYEPIARGMHAALPFLDSFESAHNFNSLLHLENILADV